MFNGNGKSQNRDTPDDRTTSTDFPKKKKMQGRKGIGWNNQLIIQRLHLALAPQQLLLAHAARRHRRLQLPLQRQQRPRRLQPPVLQVGLELLHCGQDPTLARPGAPKPTSHLPWAETSKGEVRRRKGRVDVPDRTEDPSARSLPLGSGRAGEAGKGDTSAPTFPALSVLGEWGVHSSEPRSCPDPARLGPGAPAYLWAAGQPARTGTQSRPLSLLSWADSSSSSLW